MKINNGHLTGMNSKEEIKGDVLSHMVIYIEAKNGSDNNKENPQNGSMWVDSFGDDIVAFILGNNIKDWVEIPDELILDDIERQNFIYYIKWEKDRCTGDECQ